jgi:hypothetical protein
MSTRTLVLQGLEHAMPGVLCWQLDPNSTRFSVQVPVDFLLLLVYNLLQPEEQAGPGHHSAAHVPSQGELAAGTGRHNQQPVLQ